MLFWHLYDPCLFVSTLSKCLSPCTQWKQQRLIKHASWQSQSQGLQGGLIATLSKKEQDLHNYNGQWDSQSKTSELKTSRSVARVHHLWWEIERRILHPWNIFEEIWFFWIPAAFNKSVTSELFRSSAKSRAVLLNLDTKFTPAPTQCPRVTFKLALVNTHQ